MIYLFGWGALYWAFVVSALVNYRGKLLSVLALLFIATISILRGNVGTDTVNYEHMLLSIVDTGGGGGIEPGFMVMGWAMIKFWGSVEVAVRSISLIFFVLVIVFILRADQNESFFLMAYFAPAFAYQYSMNALRIGLASLILIIAVQEIRRRGSYRGILIAMSSLFFHYSAFISILFVFISQRQWIRMSNFFLLIVATIIAIIMYYANLDYFSSKIIAYEAMSSPSVVSGLSKIIVIFIIILGIFFSSLPDEEKIKIIIPALLFVMLFGVMASFTYAGLRFLDLVSFALPVAVLATYSRLGRLFDKQVVLALFLGGAISAVGVYRGFILEFGQGKSPFLPYEFLDFLTF
ncbi:EpsG family protein [Desulfurivibrio sp. C05AmB]|uniref:EpsG family protein n=1 Tax=Desulfurivibrio sp. C05AmB TaxID=3374371 RepID=UPI00376F2141